MSEQKPKKKFSRRQLRAGQGMLTQQAKTNIYASQSGMTTFGAVRHGKDIRADDCVKEGEGVLTQQAATNVFDSQKGMTCFGAVRHGKDIAVVELFDEGDPDEYPTDEEDDTPVVQRRSGRGGDSVPSEVAQEPAAEPEPEPEAPADEEQAEDE